MISVSGPVRVVAVLAGVLAGAGCGPAASPPSTTQARPAAASPAGIDRIRTQLPKGYEFGPLPSPVSSATLWGLPPDATSEPAVCGALPIAGVATTHGWSASGTGGIVYATAGPASAPAADVLDACPAWTVTAKHTVAAVTRSDPPPIADAQTLALTVQAATRVENGAETHSQATTLVAFVQNLAVSVTVVTDPGANGPALPPEFATMLLGAAVRAVRG